MAWLSGYAYRQKIPLKRVAGAVSDYQMKLTVHKGAGSSSGSAVYLKDHALSWTGTVPNDVRFTKTDGSTELDYWIESSDANTATVWIEFDSIGTTDTDFYVYYGKSDDTTTSDGADTFPFFDHFLGDTLDGAKWYEWLSAGSYSVSGSILTVTGVSGNWEIIGAKSQYGYPKAFRFKGKLTEAETSFIGIDDRSADGNYIGDGFDLALFEYEAPDGKVYYTAREGVTDPNARVSDLSDYTILEIIRSASDVKFYEDDVLKLTESTVVPLDNCGIEIASFNVLSTYLDWALVRNFISPEPTWGTWGAEVTIPTDTTQAVSDIAKTTATGNGNITDMGGENCSERGFKYGLTETDTWSASDTDSFGTGAYTKGLTGLSENTLYYVRAFATNSAGTGYGAYVSFTTHQTHLGAATLSGIGTLAGIGVRIFTGVATLAGVGALAAIGQVFKLGKATLAGVGTLAGSAVITVIGKATLAGSGSVAGIARLIAIGKATLAGSGTLAGIGSFWRYGAVTISGIGTLAAKGVRIFVGTVTFSGIGTLATIGCRIFAGVVTLAGTGTLAGKAVITAIGKAILAGSGTLSGIARLTAIGKATLAGTGTIVIKASIFLMAKVTLAGVGTLAAIGHFCHYGKATLAGVGTLAVILTRSAFRRIMDFTGRDVNDFTGRDVQDFTGRDIQEVS